MSGGGVELVPEIVGGLVGAGVLIGVASFPIAAASGWRTLARAFRAPPGIRPARAVSWQSLLLQGRFRYARSAKVGVGPEGLFLRILPPFGLGCAPLLIPWSALRWEGERTVLAQRFARLKVDADGMPVTIEIASGSSGARMIGEELRSQQRAVRRAQRSTRRKIRR